MSDIDKVTEERDRARGEVMNLQNRINDLEEKCRVLTLSNKNQDKIIHSLVGERNSLNKRLAEQLEGSQKSEQREG